MTWNHRLYLDNSSITIIECYYGDDGKPKHWCYADAMSTDEDIKAIKSIKRQLRQMLRACDKPILTPGDFISASGK